MCSFQASVLSTSLNNSVPYFHVLLMLCALSRFQWGFPFQIHQYFIYKEVLEFLHKWLIHPLERGGFHFYQKLPAELWKVAARILTTGINWRKPNPYLNCKSPFWGIEPQRRKYIQAIAEQPGIPYRGPANELSRCGKINAPMTLITLQNWLSKVICELPCLVVKSCSSLPSKLIAFRSACSWLSIV